MPFHQAVTLARVTDAVERAHTTLDNPGFCLKCGAETDGVEPDASGYTCDFCGEAAVYGAELLLLRLA